MPKSKYPAQLDSSAEIPAVRDNVLEAGSEAINSIRSALFQIQKTLGTNPHGVAGQTVASRLDQSLDSNGNLKAEAVFSSAISDSQISEVASIKESKLQLNFSTHVLQDQISMLNSELSEISTLLDSLLSQLQAHLANAPGRHTAEAISVAIDNLIDSDIATNEIESNSVQGFIDKFYTSHVNYTGADIAEDNNSHSANQIYFDNSSVSSVITQSDVQSAVEELANSSLNLGAKHQDLFHSNGILKSGGLHDFSSSVVGTILQSSVSATFSKSSGADSGRTTLTLVTSVPTSINLELFDLILIEDESNEAISGVYQVASFETSGLVITSIDIYGLMPSSSSVSTTFTIAKKSSAATNEASLVSTVRQNAALTSSNVIQIINPNAVCAVSQDIRPSEISSTNRYVNVALDGELVTFDVYNGTLTHQTIDSIIQKINEFCEENHLALIAARVDKNNSSELIIASTVASSADLQQELIISRSTDDAIDSLGFAYIEDLSILAQPGTKYFIQGTSFEGLQLKLDVTGLSYFQSGTTISIGSLAVDFLSLRVKAGDYIFISGSSDDGFYKINNVTASTLEIDPTQLTSGWSADSVESAKFKIWESTLSLEDFEFQKISGSFGAALVQIFLDKNGYIFSHNTFEYQALLSSQTPLITLVDWQGVFENNESISVSLQEDSANSILISFDDGASVSVCGADNYVWISSGSRKLKFYIEDVSSIVSRIAIDGDLTVTLESNGSADKNSNLILSKVPYNFFNGRVGGARSSRVINCTEHGTLSSKDISTDSEYFLRELPLIDLRTPGVVSGLELTSFGKNGSGLYTFTIAAGICYVNGKRFVVDGGDYVTDINSASIDTIFIAVDDFGNVVFESAVPANCNSPFKDSNWCDLYSLEFDGTTVFSNDFRLFINDLDLKILNSITVSPQPGMGHFRELGLALKYAKRFSKLFPKAGIPAIHLKSGVHETRLSFDHSDQLSSSWIAEYDSDPESILQELYNKQIENGLFIDFPVMITGEGASSELSLIWEVEFSDPATYEMRMPLVIVGSGFSNATNPFGVISSDSVTIRDLKFKNSRLSLVDLNTDGYASFDVSVQNCIFDMEEFGSNDFDLNIGDIGIEFLEVSDFASNKGNVTISNCNFFSSYIHIQEPSRIVNLTVSHCSVSSGYSLFDEDVYSLASTANIYLLGNRTLNNIPASIVESPSTEWGDRTSRNLKVGEKLFVGSDGYIEGNLTAESYLYDSSKLITDLYTFENVTNLDFGDSSVIPATIDSANLTFSATSIKMYFAKVTQNGVLHLPIKIPYGSTLVGIELGTSLGGLTTEWTMELKKLTYPSSNGFSFSTGSYTNAISATTSTNSAGSALNFEVYNFNGLSYKSISNNSSFILKLEHDYVGTLRIYYIKAILSSASVDASIGAY